MAQEPERIQRRLSAILSADAVGYSRLMCEDQEATLCAITDARETISRAVEEYRGRVVDAPGDNVLAEFASVRDGLDCAVEIQTRLKKINADIPPEKRMEFRIGLNLGEVLVDGGKIYGSGVNIAARLEGLSEESGICISGSAFDQVGNHPGLGFEYLGKKKVKNIKEPVRCYRVLWEEQDLQRLPRTGSQVRRKPRLKMIPPVLAAALALAGAGLWLTLEKPGQGPDIAAPPTAEAPSTQTAASFEAKPSIAVLPFVNMSGDPGQDYFSDGLTEDLITDLSKASGLFVIGRNSVFVYRGRHVKPETVSRELGVRYVLEGSVRRSQNKVRITARLIDANTGYPLWSESYDRNLEDIFAVQDEVASEIISALKVKLSETEQQAVVQRDTNSLEAYDYALKGQRLLLSFKKEDHQEAKVMFEKALAADPEYASAYVGLAFAAFQSWALGWDRSPQILTRAEELAHQALKIEPEHVEARVLLGRIYVWSGRHEEALNLAENTLRSAPNNPNALAFMGHALAVAGRPKEALEYLERALRLNPTPPVWYSYHLGYAYAQLGQFGKAIENFEQVLDRNEGFTPAYWLLIASYLKEGRPDKARETVERLKRAFPGITLEAAKERMPGRNQAFKDFLVRALERAGLE